MTTITTSMIPVESLNSLGELLQARAKATPDAPAYTQYNDKTGRWDTLSWSQMAIETGHWQAAFESENLSPGDKIAIMAKNCWQWAMCDLAAQGLGLVTVPIYTNDRAENVGYILQDSNVRLLLIENEEQWDELEEVKPLLTGLTRIITLDPVKPDTPEPRLMHANDWITQAGNGFKVVKIDPDELATIVYTSGTTGRPKGVMLSHRNILWNVRGADKHIALAAEDIFLSFLPLSHTFERTIGYYLPIAEGASVAYARSIEQLADDLVTIKPTVLISVPRIFERIHRKISNKLENDPAPIRGLFKKAVDVGWRRFLHSQGRGSWSLDFLLWPLLNKLVASKIHAKLGGHLRLTVCGGAALSPDIARLFIGLGVNLVQGYGLTETSPVIACNKPSSNIPASVGVPLDGIEIMIGEHDELLTKSPSIMLGYWNNPEATHEVIDDDGWLHTGDKVRIEDDHIFITGRLKEIIVLSNGEKVPPSDVEMAVATDPLIEQVMVIGEGRPFLSALIVLDADRYYAIAEGLDLDPEDETTTINPDLHNLVLKRVKNSLHRFPGYAKINNIGIIEKPWGIDNGFMTPTMKLRRSRILEQNASLVETLYEGH